MTDDEYMQEFCNKSKNRRNLEEENLMDKKYPPIVGKCKERLDNGTCLGCNRLELYEFTGDDNCPLFRYVRWNFKINGKTRANKRH